MQGDPTVLHNKIVDKKKLLGGAEEKERHLGWLAPKKPVIGLVSRPRFNF
jgi:hypothetical protein